jgi:hypothetical protein
MRVEMNVQAEAADQFDPIWLRNAVEEPLDEAGTPWRRTDQASHG